MEPFEEEGGKMRGQTPPSGLGCQPATPMGQARVDALRAWVRAGGPSHPAVMDAVARRILGRGDL